LKQLNALFIFMALAVFSLPAFAQIKCAAAHHQQAREIADRLRELEVWSTYEFNLVADPRLLAGLARISTEKKFSVVTLSNRLEILLKGLKAERFGRRLMIPHRIHLRLLQAHLETGHPIGELVDMYNAHHRDLGPVQELKAPISTERALGLTLAEISN
jgi:hypothetical protein